MPSIRTFTPGDDSYTEIAIDDAAITAQIRYFDRGQLHDVVTAFIRALFTIRFECFDLTTGRMNWGHLDYASIGVTPHVGHDEVRNRIVLDYDIPGPDPTIGERPKWLPADVENLSLTTKPGPIHVTVTINPAGNNVRPSNFGWLNFDIRHSYPNVVEPTHPRFAWQHTIHYPQLGFNPEVMKTWEPFLLPPLRYAAIYRTTKSASAINTATGIAIHVESQLGHFIGAAATKERSLFNFSLRNSIHLRGREFVRPAQYSLQDGDDYGYGGNKMIYRLRAFHLSGAAPGAPVDWHDVADIYRRWLQARYGPDTTSVFYDKIDFIRNRARNGAVDEMSPHTVINNYGLDGAIEPPAAPQPPNSHLSQWLEMHPLRAGHPDVPGNERKPAFIPLIRRLRDRFPWLADAKIEVQAWGIEKAGVYQFICGFPPLTDTRGAGRFKTAVTAMANNGIVTSITTDPLNTIFNRLRYAGHLRWKGTAWSRIDDPSTWEPFITEPFPLAFRNAACPVSITRIGTKQFNRVWIVDHFPGVEKLPASEAAVVLERAQRRNEWGTPAEGLPVIGTGMYRAHQKQLCPTEELANYYRDKWVKPWIIDQNVRVLEFMKHGGYFCYRTDHQHIVDHEHVPRQPRVPPSPDAAYTNVIGVGSWHVRRLQCMFYDAHKLGMRFDGDQTLSTFRICHEFTPVEALVPYLDQYYPGDAVHHFVYSHLIALHQSPGRGGWGIHPGYREEKRGAAMVLPEYMLSGNRDRDPMPAMYEEGMTDEQIAEVQRARQPFFHDWKAACIAYFDANFLVAEYGVAPRSYPVTLLDTTKPVAPWNPEKPLAPTNPQTYTYNRCVQQTFNLRANIFSTGAAAVEGVRIMIPSSWLEDPIDYDHAAALQAALAARLQRDFRDFFRSGKMLGETRIMTVGGRRHKQIWAWGSGGIGPRAFDDVRPLVHHIRQDDPELGKEWDKVPLRDFSSKAWDMQVYPNGTFVDIAVSPEIRHAVWQHEGPLGRRILYTFANVSNTDLNVAFLYGRGLEGIPQTAPWRRAITIISEPDVAAPPPADAWAGHVEQALRIPKRSFAAVVVSK